MKNHKKLMRRITIIADFISGLVSTIMNPLADIPVPDFNNLYDATLL